MKTPQTAYEGEWDFSGSCAPPEHGAPHGGFCKNFTLGCFQWVKSKSAKASLRKGKVSHRVSGVSENPRDAYERAREYCAKKNAQAMR